MKVSGNNQQKQKQPPKIYWYPPVNSPSFPLNWRPQISNGHPTTPVRRKSSSVTELPDDFPIE
jgi:hypothetical protein